MNAISDTLSLLRFSRSPLVATLFVINMVLVGFKTKTRIRRFPTAKFKIDGVPYYANTWDGLLVLRPSHEREVHEAISEVARAAGGRGIFLNVGAHIGRYALEFAKDFKKTVAFEPTPATFSLLSRATEEHPHRRRIQIHQWCVGDRSGTATLLVRESESQNAIHLGGHPAPASNNFVDVEVRTLDATLQAAERADVRLIVIDVEGAEQLVLNGARGILSASDAVIIIELLDSEALDRCGRILRSLGYDGIRLDRTNWKFTKRDLISQAQ